MVSGSDTSEFIERWASSGAAERANYQLFLSELCDLLGVARPDPTKPHDADNAYVFERSVTFHHPDGTTSTGRIDLYKRGCFVLEAKQGVEKREAAEALSNATKAKTKAAKKGHAQRGSAAWDEAMLKARGQAEQYARALPATEGRPPFLIVVDVGHSIELYSEFTRTGGSYVPFPDPQSHRILLAKLCDSDVRETLRLAWTDPQSLDPSRRSARVTREIAQSLGRLAASLEKTGHGPEAVATFLMRALFTMFAEDVELLPKDSFINLLKSLHCHTEQFVPMVEELWSRMKTGGFSTVLREKIRHFNGALFEQATALPLTGDQFELLIEASRADWRDVEPAIFGTLLERALNPIERHKLGAHYTPRAYVERLVMPTIVEPLRAEWDAAKAAAVTLDRQGKTKEAAAEVQRFHRRLCEVRVLDPACGSGNFLYVTLEHLKRIEGEVFNALDRLGQEQAALEMAGFTVDPHQLLGLEVNPRASAIAELVLWIGYLQWHFRTRGRVAPPEPVIKNFHNIENRDAVLEYDRTEPVLDDQGAPVTRWDGRTMKKHPVTGEEVPDESARVPLLSYVNPRPAEWPQADFIVGNPPYIGVRRLKLSIGDEYVDTLRNTYPDVPETSDYVMYWWEKAALAVASGATRRFGFITTNSIVQSYSRRVIEKHIGEDGKVTLAFAIPDHPWVDAADGAAVRVAMTVGCAASESIANARLGSAGYGENDPVTFCEVPRIGSSLDVVSVHEKIQPLESNASMCFQGVVPAGDGFKLDADELMALGYAADSLPTVIRRYIIGKDLVQHPETRYIIDFFGVSAADALDRYPQLYQRLRDRVYPERAENKRASYREKWWIFAEPRPAMRHALAGLSRFIVTPYTAKYRPFVFVSGDTMPDAMAYAIASDDGAVLGALSSRAHAVWALATGGTLEDRPRYNSSATFFPFPFPTATEAQQTQIRNLAECLDTHRKRQQAQHPKLTLTDCYNVLEKLRAGTPLNKKEQVTHEQGLVSVLRQLHDDLDAAVADAYGLPPNATDEAILAHLCALNAQRAGEERNGLIRYLRPKFQNPESTATQTTLATNGTKATDTTITAKPAGKLPWPKSLAEQVQAVRSALAVPTDATTLARSFKGAKLERVEDILETLASLGQARALQGEKFVAP
ncbi:MAG: class I SAM-dependent DNA methyltransferase [Chthoniobacterales bacterium]|nr:class I SAM-dependent DNA methyltransferase [Chthoniobacterales bacterium]